ncbi:hypothetical protein J6590_100140 [Homalodisca vitripennis]|nr:hypothetical protein J6590_100140 [Homalodisca vitripennis]
MGKRRSQGKCHGLTYQLRITKIIQRKQSVTLYSLSKAVDLLDQQLQNLIWFKKGNQVKKHGRQTILTQEEEKLFVSRLQICGSTSKPKKKRTKVPVTPGKTVAVSDFGVEQDTSAIPSTSKDTGKLSTRQKTKRKSLVSDSTSEDSNYSLQDSDQDASSTSWDTLGRLVYVTSAAACRLASFDLDRRPVGLESARGIAVWHNAAQAGQASTLPLGNADKCHSA